MRWMVLVFLGACSYGLLSTLVKIAYARGFDVSEVSGSQVFLGTLMMWGLFLLFSRKPASKQDALKLFFAGMPVGLTGMLYYASLQYLSASLAIILLFQFTWIGLLLEALMERKRPGRDKVMALSLLLIGTVLAAGVLEQGIGPFSPIGVLLGFLSSLSYTLVLVFSGKVALGVNSWTRSAIMTTGSAMLVLAVFPPAFLVNGRLFDGLATWALLIALFGVIIPTLFFNIGIPRIGVGLSTILGAAELPTAVLMSTLVLKESVSLLQWVGVVVILVGIALPELYRRRMSQATSGTENG